MTFEILWQIIPNPLKYTQGYFRQILIDHILLKVVVKPEGKRWFCSSKCGALPHYAW